MASSVFALDVTNPAAITTESVLASDVLWDFTDADMGLGFSTPALTNTSDGWQVFVGNGYNSRNQKPFLYALNPQSGAATTKIDLCAAVPTACNLECIERSVHRHRGELERPADPVFESRVCGRSAGQLVAHRHLESEPDAVAR